MGSRRFEGVRFQCYVHDHLPPHVHAFYAGSEVIIELLSNGTVRVAIRDDAVSPGASVNEVRYMLDLAHLNSAELNALWRSIHG